MKAIATLFVCFSVSGCASHISLDAARFAAQATDYEQIRQRLGAPEHETYEHGQVTAFYRDPGLHTSWVLLVPVAHLVLWPIPVVERIFWYHPRNVTVRYDPRTDHVLDVTSTRGETRIVE